MSRYRSQGHHENFGRKKITNINQLTRLVLMFMLLVFEKIRGWGHQKNDKYGGTLNRYQRNGRQFIGIYWIEFYYKSLFSVHIRFKVRPKLAVRRQRVIHSRLTIFERLLSSGQQI